MKDFSWEKTGKEVSEVFKKAAEKKDILFFSSDDWDSGLKTSKYHLALNLSRNHRVIFIESIGLRKPNVGSGRDINKIFNKFKKWSKGLRKIHENLYIYTPIVMPFHNNRFMRAINSILLRGQVNSIYRKLSLKNPLYWTFMPNTAGLFNKRNGKLIYYCVDNMSGFNGVDRHEINKMDAELTETADVVFTVSRKIYEEKKEINPNTYYMPHGVNYEHFAGGSRLGLRDGMRCPLEQYRDRGRPIIGFYGLISKDWVDFGLVGYIAEKHPEWSIVMIGKVDVAKENLPQNKNIHYLGSIDYSVLPSYAHYFDVAMIPFNINELTKYCNPLKIYEYFAMGKPVVSTDIPEVRQFNGMVRIAKNQEEFIKGIEEALKEDNEELSLKRKEFTKAGTWENRCYEIQKIIDNHI
jgi:glycosyltransferase involved in cell wall biosynthesis